MNYIKLINNFWALRRNTKITNLQADLYFFLIHECNLQKWQNPFECSNLRIQDGINIAWSSLRDAREQLVILGLISFEQGQKNVSKPVYNLIECCADNRHRKQEQKHDVAAPVVPITDTEKQNVVPITDTAAATYKNKRKHTINNKHKQSISHTGASPEKVTKKKPFEANEFWKEFVATWDDFYLSKKGEKYFYMAKDFGCLNKIYQFLKKRSADKKFQWNVDNMTAGFKFFLTRAYGKDNWLPENFTIPNVLSQFNQIANASRKQSSANGQKQATGSGVDTSSAFSKIDAMAGKNSN